MAVKFRFDLSGLDTLEPAKFPFLAGRPLEWHAGLPNNSCQPKWNISLEGSCQSFLRLLQILTVVCGNDSDLECDFLFWSIKPSKNIQKQYPKLFKPIFEGPDHGSDAWDCRPGRVFGWKWGGGHHFYVTCMTPKTNADPVFHEGHATPLGIILA